MGGEEIMAAAVVVVQSTNLAELELLLFVVALLVVDLIHVG